MFTTLKYRPHVSLSQVGKNASSKRGSTSNSRLACINCRKTKLRCTGDCPACKRCALKGLECTYPKRANHGSRKKAVSSGDRGVQNKDQPNSPRQDLVVAESRDPHNERSNSVHSPAPHDTHTNPGPAEPSRSQSISADLQICEMASLGEESLDFDFQLPTPVETSNGSIKSPDSRSTSIGAQSAFDLSAYDCEFSASGFDLRAWDSGLFPFSSGPLCDPLPDKAWPQDSTASQSTEVISISPPDTGNFSKPPPSECACLHEAITSLEEASMWTELEDFLFAESMLAAHKKSLATCEALFLCGRCPSPSSTTMLVLMILDKLLASFRAIHAAGRSYVVTDAATAQEDRRCDPDRRRQGSALSNACSSGVPATLSGRDVALGAYRIESSREWARAVNILVAFQLSRLDSLLFKVRARVYAAEEDLQMQIVQQKEHQLRMLKAHFDQSTSHSLC